MEREYLEELGAILEKGWSEKTIHPAYKWDPEKKSSGQCYVTARAVHEILEWELLNSAKEHQFWNKLLDGSEADFTSKQSGGDGIHPVDGFSGKPRKFKPIEGRKNINPRLKAYLDVVEEPLLQFKEKYSDVLKTATRNPTLEDARLVAKHAKYVRIDEEAIDTLAREWAKKDIELPKWDWFVDMSLSKEDRFDHFLVGGCLNFNFWNKEPDETYKTVWKGQEHWGAAGLFASLQRAEERGTNILDGQYLANITEKELEEMFGAESGHPIPMLKERTRILNAVGKKLVEKYDGKFHNILKKTGNEVKLVDFVEFLVKEFPEAFADVSKHGSGKIRFYKKAYLAAAQAYGNGCLKIADLENSVVFADYVVPAYARHEGMTRYSDELAGEVDSGKTIEAGSEKENEVRAVGGIFVHNRLKDRTNFHRRKIGKPPITGFHIDAAAYLGGVRLAKSGVKLNHHRTLTTNY